MVVLKEGPIIEVETMDDLDTRLKNAGRKLVCIYFTAPWCGPCKMTGKTIAQIAEEETEVVFLKVDGSVLEDATDKFEVSVMPTFCFIKNTIRMEAYIGGKLDSFRETINRLKGEEPTSAGK